MKNNDTCIHGGNSPIALLENLHQSQGGSGRHHCPTCAYEQGFNLGSSGTWTSYEAYCATLTDSETCQTGSIAPTHILAHLGDNQGGPGRHKCTNCAFKQGFEVGLLDNAELSIRIERVPVPAALPQDSQDHPTKPHLQTDFIEQELRNKHLGLLGELFMLRSEIEFLNEHGKMDLAEKVQHVSVEIGDGLGYDILSYDLDGNEKKIEVKTTRSSADRPFYLTRNELDVAAKNPETYCVYRLFDFDPKLNRGKYYVIEGDLRSALSLEPTVYVAFPRAEEGN